MELLLVAVAVVRLAIAARTRRIPYAFIFFKPLYVEQSKRPKSFWVVVAFYIAVATMVAIDATRSLTS